MNGVSWGLLATALLAGCSGEGRGARAFPVPGEQGPRVLAEVLNASGRPGLARTGTRVLRESGIDVVYFGNAPAASASLDSTRIVVLRGDGSGARRVREILGVGQVVTELDPDRLLDVRVLLGADFAPRLELHP